MQAVALAEAATGRARFGLLPVALFSIGRIWTNNQNAWLFLPLDLLLLGPGFRWVWTGGPAPAGRGQLPCCTVRVP